MAAAPADHEGMEIIGVAIFIVILASIAATLEGLRTDGRGHTPAVRSDYDWTALELPSVNYIRRFL